MLAELNLRERALSRYGCCVKSAQLAVTAIVLPQVSTLLWWLQTHSWIHLRGFVNIEYLLLFAVALLYPGWLMISALTGRAYDRPPGAGGTPVLLLSRRCSPVITVSVVRAIPCADRLLAFPPSDY
jgi:hypothetical protein